MAELLLRLGFLVIPDGEPMITALYYAHLVGAEARKFKNVCRPKYDLTVITIGKFGDFLPRHINSSDHVYIDIRIGRIVSPDR